MSNLVYNIFKYFDLGVVETYVTSICVEESELLTRFIEATHQSRRQLTTLLESDRLNLVGVRELYNALRDDNIELIHCRYDVETNDCILYFLCEHRDALNRLKDMLENGLLEDLLKNMLSFKKFSSPGCCLRVAPEEFQQAKNHFSTNCKQ